MKAIRNFTWAEGKKAIACDFDHVGRLTALLLLPSNELRVEINGAAYALPPGWVTHVARIRWAGEAEVLLWPIDSPIGKLPHVGRIGPNGADVLGMDYPLDVFSDLDVIACTYPEERVVNGGDQVSIFSSSNFGRIARFIDSFMTCSEEMRTGLLEVEHGVLDGSTKRFWFTAYATENLWCFSLGPPRIMACKLRCPRDEIMAITCQGEVVSIFVKHQRSFSIHKYKSIGSELIFDVQTEAPSHDLLWREVLGKLRQPSAELRGRSGDMIILTTERSALLAGL